MSDIVQPLVSVDEQREWWYVNALVAEDNGGHEIATHCREEKDRVFPPFAILGGFTTMKLSDEEGYYYRPAGAWGAQAVWVGDDLVCDFPTMPGLHGELFEEITEEEFMKENEGYL